MSDKVVIHGKLKKRVEVEASGYILALVGAGIEAPKTVHIGGKRIDLSTTASDGENYTYVYRVRGEQ